MKKFRRIVIVRYLAFILFPFWNNPLVACSTFLIKDKNILVVAHNLDDDLARPGLIFVNKRGILKRGRTWSEISYKDGRNGSTTTWISRYGSVTFNPFVKETISGGINEAGLCIYEMTLKESVYPKNQALQKMYDCQWEQFVLDNYSTVDDVIQSANEFELDGTGGRHFFTADYMGNSAIIELIDGKVIVYKNDEMPLKILLNQPYAKDLEIMSLFKGFGGQYEPDFKDNRIPRLAKAAVMLKEYDGSVSAVDYSFKILEKENGEQPAKWSIVYDSKSKMIYFLTEVSKEVKSLSMDSLDFSNSSPTLILDIDTKEGGNVLSRFKPFNILEHKALIDFCGKNWTDEDFTGTGQTKNEVFQKIETVFLSSGMAQSHYLTGKWKATNVTFEGSSIKNDNWELIIDTSNDVVTGEITNTIGSISKKKIDHIQTINKDIKFSFRSDRNTIFYLKGEYENNLIKAKVLGMEGSFGEIVFKKQ